MNFLKFKMSLSKLFLNYLSGKLGIFDNKNLPINQEKRVIVVILRHQNQNIFFEQSISFNQQ